MSPKHPKLEGVFVSEETLKDPEALKESEKSAKQVVDALNKGMSKD
jgi:hypothetical protein